MKVLPLNNFASPSKNIGFKMEIGDCDDYETSNDSRYGGIRQTIGDMFHPINIDLKFHENGKISDVNIKYKNGKFAEGEIHEKYDKEGNNVNYLA